jgi:hypothetical protein
MHYANRRTQQQLKDVGKSLGFGVGRLADYVWETRAVFAPFFVCSMLPQEALA